MWDIRIMTSDELDRKSKEVKERLVVIIQSVELTTKEVLSVPGGFLTRRLAIEIAEAIIEELPIWVVEEENVSE